MLPLLLDATLSGRIPLDRLVACTSVAPARILGLPRKGALRIGNDADVVLADPDGTTTIDETRLHSKAGWSPFHGRQLRGRLAATLLRGETIVRDGEIVAESPRGGYVRVDG